MTINIARSELRAEGVQSPPEAFPTVLVCDSAVVRAGLHHLLSKTRFAVTEAPLVEKLATPLLFLVHVNRWSDELMETIRSLKAQHPSAWVAVLTDKATPAQVMRAYQAGMDGLCSTATSRDALAKSLELVVLGGPTIPVALGLEILKAAKAPAVQSAAVSSELTHREAEILHQVREGAPNKLIARRLGLGEATVKVHLKAILRKVGAVNRTQAAMWAQQHLHKTQMASRGSY